MEHKLNIIMVVLAVVLALIQVQCLEPALQGTVDGSYQNVIAVDAERGSDNSSCWNHSASSLPCRTLNFALEGAQRFNSTKILLESGDHELYPHPNVTEFRWAVDFALVGNTSADLLGALPAASVNCLPGAGLTFLNCNGVSIQNIQFSRCGVLQLSASRNFTDATLPYLEFLTAFYFLFCRDVSFTGVTVTRSNGMGMIMYATVGDNSFRYCDFSFNSVNSTEIPGGGGLYIEFPYCSPGDFNCMSGPSNISSEFSSNATYTFDHCSFENNTALSGNELSGNETIISYVPGGLINWPFGRGGGLSIYFKGNSRNLRITVNNSSVVGNEAIWGAGVFVEFQDLSANNTFAMHLVTINENHCLNSTFYSEGTGGGGVRLGYIFYQTTHVHDNHILLDSCSITKNTATWGGGVSFYAAREPEALEATNTLQFANCEWVSNVARLGSAVDLTAWHPVTEGVLLHVKFSDCRFRDNTVMYVAPLGGAVGVGTFFTDSIPVEFSGSIIFERNDQSALAVSATTVDFLDDSTGNFVGNSGRNGGAIQLLAYASIRVHNNTRVNFINNSALYKGGAIYVRLIGEHDLLASLNCFIRYEDFQASPWDWNTTFYFEGNRANNLKEQNSIYSTSVLACVWGGLYGPSAKIDLAVVEQVFCWGEERWNYSGSNCSSEIATAPTTFTISHEAYNFTAFPGKERQLPVQVLDDFGRIVTEPQVYGVQSTSNATTNTSYISNDVITVYGQSSTSAHFSLETSSPKVLHTELVVELLPCPPGFILRDNNSCVCGGSYRGLVICSELEVKSELRQGGWMGAVDGELLVGNHPHSPGSFFVKYFELPNLALELDDVICAPLKRTGVLCGACIDGYAPAFATPTFDCVPCTKNKAKYHWVFYLLAKLLPLTLLLFIVLIFHISATQGSANAFIFFAQILVTNINLGGQNARGIQVDSIDSAYGVFRDIYIVVYSLANLNFFEPLIPRVCLAENLDTMKVISLEYIIAAYPLFLLLLIFALVQLYEKGKTPVYQIFKPVHHCFARIRRKWNLQHSIFDAFTTFIILSYTKFIFISFYYLIPAHLYNDQGNSVGFGRLYFNGNVEVFSATHIPYFVAALFFIAVFVIALPLLLLVYPLKLLQKCTGWTPGSSMSQILSAFQGCYKDGTNNTRDCRYFAGLYLIIRIILFLIFVSTTPNWFLQFLLKQLLYTCAVLLFAVVRPYQDDFYNNFDAAIFSIIAAINTLNVYINSLTAFGAHEDWPVIMQFILIYCPLVYVIGSVIYQRKVVHGCKCVAMCCKGETRQSLYQPIDGVNLSESGLGNDESVNLEELSIRMQEQICSNQLQLNT